MLKGEGLLFELIILSAEGLKLSLVFIERLIDLDLKVLLKRALLLGLGLHLDVGLLTHQQTLALRELTLVSLKLLLEVGHLPLQLVLLVLDVPQLLLSPLVLLGDL